ncbi:MAG: glycoside hydrolase family 127 protein [Anaerolineaceae bacterium]|nr:MAG: glycoside hydrolase family 127 protein [Anaerolineaceae bacterium]
MVNKNDIGAMKNTKGTEVLFTKSSIKEGFWSTMQDLILNVTLPMEYEQLLKTGRIDSLKLEWKPGDPHKPHFFWDSDIAKWIEAVSYSLSLRWDESLIEKVDKVVDMIEAIQEPDGYFNIYYQTIEPEKRFTYLKRMHEFYCLGHMIEGAVAYYQATGKRKLLDICCRYADLVYKVIGRGEGQIPGYDGHPEIELALVKLYRETGVERYLELSSFFIEERGTEPHFFDIECEARGEAIKNREYRFDMQGKYAYYQAHKPVYEQDKAAGHAVRALYLYCGMIDVAKLEDNKRLLEVCHELWKNITTRQMYITGGVGTNYRGERFTYDYDLYNSMSYNETCASIALVMFAHRLLNDSPKGEYGDIMERCLYNNIRGGISLSGDRFYYSNPLTAVPEAYQNMIEDWSHLTLMRQEWFEVACCPPNLARLMMSLSGYIYSIDEDNIYTHLYINSETELEIGNDLVKLSQKSNYPWESDIQFELELDRSLTFSLNLRLPSWSKTFKVIINGAHTEDFLVKDGFIIINREWTSGDKVELSLDLGVRLIEARPEVIDDCGKIALERGPIIYCLEEIDNGANLHDLTINSNKVREQYDPELLGGVVVLEADGFKRSTACWNQDELYRELGKATENVTIKAVPYYTRLNRTEGEMIVWINYNYKTY